MISPYKVKHWSPVKRIPKSVDGWYNVLEWEDVDADEYGENIEENALKRFKETEEKYREYIHKPIYTGNGILD